MAFKKQTVKYVQALAIAETLKIKNYKKLSQISLYEAIEAQAYHWDMQEREWLKGMGTEMKECRIAVKSSGALLDDYMEHVQQALMEYGFHQIGGSSKPFAEVKDGQETGNFTVWMTFKEPDEDEVDTTEE